MNFETFYNSFTDVVAQFINVCRDIGFTLLLPIDDVIVELNSSGGVIATAVADMLDNFISVMPFDVGGYSIVVLFLGAGLLFTLVYALVRYFLPFI